MSKELLSQTIKLFENSNNPDKWNAYLEMVSQKERIKNHWFLKLKSELIKYFQTDLEDEWMWSENSMNWYLREFGHQSLSIWFENYTKFSLWVNKNEFDSKRIMELLQTEKYSILLSSFSRIDKRFENDGQYMVIEDGNFSFDSPFDGEFEIDNIAWYAGNQTNDFLRQIADKVNRIRKDKVLTNLLKEICEATKIVK